MGYFTENPHVNYNQGNYDYFVNKLKELDKELKDFETEVHAKFNEIDDEFVQVRDEMLEQARVLRSEIAAVKTELLEDFSEYQESIAQTIEGLEQDIEHLSDNIAEYVAEHMDEWQLEAVTGENNDIIIGDYDPEQPITEGGNLNDIIIGNVKYNIRQFNIEFYRGLSLQFDDTDLSALSGAKQLANITPSFDLYAYFQKAETEFGLDGNNCIDYIFPIITCPSDWGSSDMLTMATYQIVLSGMRVQKANDGYRLQISYGVGNYTHLSGYINIRVLPLYPYLG